MSTEVVPETVLRAFIRTYPNLFSAADLSGFGLIADRDFGWPIGFSRARPAHLGGLSSVGMNCAACHVGQVRSKDGTNLRVLGMTSQFDAEGYFGALIVATFQTAAPDNMKSFLAEYLLANDPRAGGKERELFASEWKRQEKTIRAVLASDPAGTNGIKPNALQALKSGDFALSGELLRAGGVDLAALSHSMVKLFHNMRAALHVPDQPPASAPPASGPGRNDAFGLLSAALFGEPQPYAPVKYGLVWNIEKRHWVHWDGNTQSPIGRNLLAALGLGAPLDGKHGNLEFALVQRHTVLSESICAPRYPFAIDEAAAKRGAAHYQARCASCHDGPEGDGRLYDVAVIGTEPNRAQAFNAQQATRFNSFLADLRTAGYTPGKEPGLRSTQKYWAASLTGVWARSPYLHNGSVRTMRDLLEPPASRPGSFHRGSIDYDEPAMGYADGGSYLLDTATRGNSNAGHAYGTDLSAGQKGDLIEYLKTL